MDLKDIQATLDSIKNEVKAGNESSKAELEQKLNGLNAEIGKLSSKEEVAEVKKMLDAVQGSAPSRRKVNGTSTPNRPEAMQAPVMASRMTKPSSNASCALPPAVQYIARPATMPVSTPFIAPRANSFAISLRTGKWFKSPSVIPRRVIASA